MSHTVRSGVALACALAIVVSLHVPSLRAQAAPVQQAPPADAAQAPPPAPAGPVVPQAAVPAQVPAGEVPTGIVPLVAQPSNRIVLFDGQSTILNTDFDIVRVAVTNPAVADATAIDSRQLLIDGKLPGSVSLIVWGETTTVQYEVNVGSRAGALQRRLNAQFPGENINVTITEQATTLSGTVSNGAVSLKAAEIAGQMSGTAVRVINLLQIAGLADTQQVLLQVRFAEVNRQALQELGISIFTGPGGIRGFAGRGTTQQFSAPEFDVNADATSITFSDFLNLFVFDLSHNIGAVIRALQSRGLAQSLAEPNLLAYNGQEASFLAGGEIPVPIAQGNSGAVSVSYKEFGIRLNFTPQIAGDVIRLHVRPEVSALDFANGVTLAGFRIPALTTRRAETNIELRDGQSFAIAGLMDNVSSVVRENIPVLSSLPIIGNFFKSRQRKQNSTELMVLITPRLVRPLNPDEVPELPINPNDFLPPVDRLGGQLQGGGGTVDAPAGRGR